MSSFWDGMFGRFFQDGAEIDIGSGFNAKSPILASRNGVTKRIDLELDAAAASAAGYMWSGGDTAIPTGSSPTTEDIALNSTTTSLDLTAIALDGRAADISHRVWVAKTDGTALYRDVLQYAVYRESASSEIHLIGIDPSTSIVVGTGSQTLTLTGPSSSLTYKVIGAHSGSLTLSLVLSATSYKAQANTWRGAYWEAPVA